MKRYILFPLLPFLLTLLLPFPADAQGLYIDSASSSRESLLRSPADPALSLTKRRLSIEVVDASATVTLSETFHNSSQSMLEGTYVFPLPPDAAATGVSLRINEKLVAGEMLDRDRARKIYTDIVRKERDPGLLEYVGLGLLRASVFPIAPESDVVVTLSFVSAVRQVDSLWHFSFPLTTRVGGEPEVVIDASIRSQRAIRNIFSPTHGIDVARISDHAARVTHEGRHREHRNFSLYYSLSNEEYGFSLLTHSTQERENFFMLMLSPRFDLDPGKVIPKDVVFVIDKSGSMEGEKWAQASAALKYCIRQLDGEDRFGILAFSTDTRLFKPSLVKADDRAKTRASAFVDRLEPKGGTDLHGALLQALGRLSRSNRLCMVALLTDGLPSVGVTDPDRIIRAVEKKNKMKSRIFNFGVGHDVNTFLLDSITRATRGATEYIDEGENIELKVSSYFSKISDPVLTDVALAFEGVETFDVYPRPMNDIFAGSSLVAVGRFEGSHVEKESAIVGKKGSMILTGRIGGEPVTFPFEAEFRGKGEADFLPTYWAMRKIGYLLNEIRLSGPSDEVEKEVISLARKYSLVTPYTSALVLEDEERLAQATDRQGRSQPADSVPGTGGSKPKASVPGTPSGPGTQSGTLSRRHRLARRGKPVTLPGRGTSTGGMGRKARRGGPSGACIPSPGPAATGKKSVKEAKNLDRLERFGNLPTGKPPGESSGKKEPQVVHLGTLSFLHVGDRLVDSRFTASMKDKLIRIQAFSDEYFALLDKGEEVKKILALGEKIIFLFDKKVYEIYSKSD